jgi:hypothetical protein
MHSIKSLRGTSLILIVCLSSYVLQANAGLIVRQSRPVKPKLYLCMGQLNAFAAGFRQINNIGEAKLIGVASIDPDNDLVIHEDLLRRQIALVFPSSESTGVGILDWEGKGMEILATAAPTSPDFITVLSKFKKVMNISKQIRPNIRWGFYGLPFRNYWNINEAWKKRCLALTPLFQTCDFIAPSLYSLYPDSLYNKSNEVYVHENIQMVLRVSEVVNKDVYPFIWHRLPGNMIMKKTEFMRHAKQIIKERYKQRQVSGLIWYGEEVYGRNIKNAQILSEAGSAKGFETYISQLIQNYGSGLLELFK